MSNWDFTNDSSSSSSSGDSDTSPDFSPTHPTTTSTSTSRTMTNGSHIPSHSHSQKPLSTAGHKSFPSNWKPSKNTGKSSAHQVSSSASSLPNSTATRRGHGHDEKEKKSRKKVAKACLTCQKSHLTCDERKSLLGLGRLVVSCPVLLPPGLCSVSPKVFRSDIMREYMLLI